MKELNATPNVERDDSPMPTSQASLDKCDAETKSLDEETQSQFAEPKVKPHLDAKSETEDKGMEDLDLGKQQCDAKIEPLDQQFQDGDAKIEPLDQQFQDGDAPLDPSIKLKLLNKVQTVPLNEVIQTSCSDTDKNKPVTLPSVNVNVVTQPNGTVTQTEKSATPSPSSKRKASKRSNDFSQCTDKVTQMSADAQHLSDAEETELNISNEKLKHLSQSEFNDYVRRRRRRKKLQQQQQQQRRVPEEEDELHLGEPLLKRRPNNLSLDSDRRKKKSVSPDFIEPEPLSTATQEKLMDFREIQAASKEAEFRTGYDDDVDFNYSSDEDRKIIQRVHADRKRKKDKCDFQPAPKMNTFVGFLRLANYVNAMVVVFGVIVSILLEENNESATGNDRLRRNDDAEEIFEPEEWDFWRQFVYITSGWIQVGYLVVVSVLTMIDAVGTVTFRWKEYGELTHSQADATSVIFFLCKSRWLWRLSCGLALASSVSLSVTTVMKAASKQENVETVPLEPLWFIVLSTISVASTIIGFLLSLFPWHGVSWLYGRFCVTHVEDKGDVWKKTWGRQIQMIHEGHRPTLEQRRSSWLASGLSEGLNAVIDVLALLTFIAAYVIGMGVHVFCILAMPKKSVDDVEMWAVIVSAFSCISIDLIALVYIIIQIVKISGHCFTAGQCGFSFQLPFAAKFFAPFTLNSAVRLLMDLAKVDSVEYVEVVKEAKFVISIIWINLIVLMLAVEIIRAATYLTPCKKGSKFFRSFGLFFSENVQEEGVNKKTVRFLDTLGSVFALTGMILSFASLFIDQYDLNFAPEGVVKDVVDVTKDFQSAVRQVTTRLKSLIDALDKRFTCEDVFKALGTTTAIALFTSFFPGVSSAANIGAKSAYYGVRAANAIWNLAQKLKKSATIIWRVAAAVIKMNKFMASHLKKVIIATNSTTLAKLLPFLPPVVIGLYVMFGCFWPKRILFFSAKQRRKTIAGHFYTWILAILIQIIALVINTTLVDELVTLLDDNIPLAMITLNRKLGWTLSMAASAFALAGSFSFCIATLILKVQTFKDHQNITNEELDWKAELEKRELVTIKTAIGNKIEKRTQLKYKKERIGPWTWILPIILCLIACGFGVLANLYPKLEMRREPRGM